MFIHTRAVLIRWVPAVMWAALILAVSATPEPLSRLLGDTNAAQTALTVFGVNLLSLLDYPYHFLVYFILAFLVARAVLWGRVPTTKRLMLVFVLVMVIAVVDEVQQLFVPTRDFEVIDLVMDSFGATGGLFIFSILQDKIK